MQTQEAYLTGFAAFLNGLMLVLFDIPPALVLVVFIGTFCGLVYRPGIEMPSNNKDKLILFFKTLGWLIVSTVVASVLVPFVSSVLPHIAQKTLAFITGFVLMYKREAVFDAIDFFISKFSEKVN